MTCLLRKLSEHYDYLVAQIKELELQLQLSLDVDEAGQHLLSTQLGNGIQYGSSRNFAASIGLVPRLYSTGGRTTFAGHQ